MSRTFVVALIFASIIWTGCEKRTVSDEGIGISLSRPDPPEFERLYTAKINPEISLKVTIRKYTWGLAKDGELYQSDGKWVDFDPDNPADKILDQSILPEVQRRCSQIIALDKEFRSGNPAEFTDSDGTIWRRANP